MSKQNTIDLINSAQPGLSAGDYTIKLEQSISIDDKVLEGAPFSAEKKFAVLGDRFSINPLDIHTIYPPANSKKNYSDIIPHIILNRSSLPWEREISYKPKTVTPTPWLALLLFYEDEPVNSQLISLSALKATTGAKFPAITLETGQTEKDKVEVINISRSLLEKVIPSASDLPYMTHVQRSDSEEKAVILSNRKPKNGATNNAFLVSLENRYKSGEFDFQDAKPEEFIRLVVLKSWSFADEAFYKIPEQDSEKEPPAILTGDILTELRKIKGEYRGQDRFLAELTKSLSADFVEQNKNEILKYAIDNTPVFKRHLSNLDCNTLKMPLVSNAETDAYLSEGFVPLSHYIRNGSTTVSWYHGPLLPGQKDRQEDIKFPIDKGDQLLQYDDEYGMLNVSYAAAWELGRLLCLAGKATSKELFNWKRNHIHGQNLDRQQSEYTHLPVGNNPEPHEFSQGLIDWFEGLKQLEGVPFHYLIPQWQQLPEESMRFFQIDAYWVKCLIQGALQVGGELMKECEEDFAEIRRQEPMCGFFIHSDLVAIWPDLQIDAYQSGETLTSVRIDRISNKILLCLFKGGRCDKAVVHQKPQGRHFCIDISVSGAFYKRFDSDKKAEIPWKEDDKAGTIIMKKLATDIKAKTSAEFAKIMMDQQLQGMMFLEGSQD